MKVILGMIIFTRVFKISLCKKSTREELFKKINEDSNLAKEIVNYVFQKYPYILPRFMEFNNSVIKGIIESSFYQADTLEMKRNGSYELLLREISSKKNDSRTGSQPSTSLFSCSRAIRYSSGNPRFSEYREGSSGTSIILVSTHDGKYHPDSIPNRDAGCYINKKCVYNHHCVNKTQNIKKDFKRCSVKDFNDLMSTDIVELLEKNLAWLTGHRPHVIINHLHRTKLDANREIGIATFGVPQAEQAWRDFHNLIERAKKNLNGRRGIIFDIHGNSVPDGLTMLGYGIHPSEMQRKTITMNMTTIENLGRFAKVPFEQIVRGELSLGHYLSQKGYMVIPSPKIRRPRGRSYYRGSYTIKEHGSNRKVNGGVVDAIQIEVHENHRNDKDVKRFALALAQAMNKFVLNNYKYQIETSPNKQKSWYENEIQW